MRPFTSSIARRMHRSTALGAIAALGITLASTLLPLATTHAAAGSTVLSVQTIRAKSYSQGGNYAWPFSVAADAAGNVDIAFTYSQPDYSWMPAVVQVTPTGSQTKLLSDQAGGIALDAQGDLYMAAGPDVLKRTPAGQTSQMPANPATAPYPINGAQYVATDSQGNVYVDDGARVIRLANDGTTETSIPTCGAPSGLAVDRQGNLYVACNGAISKTAPNGTQTTVPVTGLSPNPADLALDTYGDLFIADRYNHRVVEIATNGTQMTLTIPTGTNNPLDPTGIALSPSGTTLYVADFSSNQVEVVALSTVVNPWAPCAVEWGTCAISGTQLMAFGANDHYIYRYATTGTLACDVSSFGIDPVPGAVKSCYTLGLAPVSPWAQCASENGTCSFSGTMLVAFGANGAYTYKTLSNGTPCTTGIFGDPIFGTVKACYAVPQPN